MNDHTYLWLMDERGIRFRGIFCITILLMCCTALPVSAEVRTLNPGDSIQENITGAAPGDTIVLNPGTYTQHAILVSKNITIRANASRGGTAENTIINAELQDRIFTMNEPFSLVIDNLSLENGNTTGTGGAIALPYAGGTLAVTSSAFTNCSAFSGGAIHAGSPDTRITVSASSFSNCSADTMGGAIYSYGGAAISSSAFASCTAGRWGGAIHSGGTTGSSTITASSFTNCSSNQNGGGIYFRSGTHTVTSSRFTNCSAEYGGAIHAGMFGSTNVTVATSSFANCSATQYGGAVLVEGGGTAAITSSTFSSCVGRDTAAIHSRGTSAIHFCRFDNGGNLVLSMAAGSCDATDNWWGSNADPAPVTSGGVTSSPWLVLTATAVPAAITTNQKSAVRITITNNSDGTDTTGGGIFIPDGVRGTFSVVSGGGSVSPLANRTVDGAARTRFTPAGAGTSTISGTVDGQAVSATITVTVPVQPVANFTATPRTGTAPLTVRFADRSTNSPTAWKWYFGDGSAVNSTLKNPVHTYTSPGTYPVTLNASNGGGSNITRRTGYITVTAMAPIVTGITPASGKQGTLIAITTLSGTGFRTGARVFFNKTGSPPIAITNVTVISPTRINGTVKIPAGAVIGLWDVTVKNTDGKSGKKAGIFMVKTPLPPTVTGLTPPSAKRGRLVWITNLSGTGFVGTPTPKVQLLKSPAVITATNVTVASGKKITCSFFLPAGAATGSWHARVTNGDQQTGVMNGAFTVTV